MKLDKKRLMQNAGLLNEEQGAGEVMYAQAVMSHGANLVGKHISVKFGETMHGRSFNGDYLVIGYGKIVKDNSHQSNFTHNDARQDVLVIRNTKALHSDAYDTMLFHPSDLRSGNITITQ